MNRRSFLSLVAALPFAGWGVAKAAPAFNLTATEVRRRIYESPAPTVWTKTVSELHEFIITPPLLVSDSDEVVADFYNGKWRYFKDDHELG
jgi:hypothetical protein